MTKDEALRLALEALEDWNTPFNGSPDEELITAIKAALEAKDEPVAEVTSETGAEITMSWWHEPALPVGTKLYITPPQRKPLTDEEIYLCTNHIDRNARGWANEFARAIEAAHGIT